MINLSTFLTEADKEAIAKAEAKREGKNAKRKLALGAPGMRAIWAGEKKLLEEKREKEMIRV